MTSALTREQSSVNWNNYTRVAVVTTLALAALTLTVTALALTIIFAPATFGALGTLSAGIILIPTMVTGGLTLASFATTTVLALYDKKNNKRLQAEAAIQRVAKEAAAKAAAKPAAEAEIVTAAAEAEIVTDAAKAAAKPATQSEIVTDAAEAEIERAAAQYELVTDLEDFRREIAALPNNKAITFGQLDLNLSKASVPEENRAVLMCRDAAHNAYKELEKLKHLIDQKILSQFEAFMEHFKRFNEQDLTFEGVKQLIGPSNERDLKKEEFKDTVNAKCNDIPNNSFDTEIDLIYQKFIEEFYIAKKENDHNKVVNETFKPAALIMNNYFLKIIEDLMSMKEYYQSVKGPKKTGIGALLRLKADPQEIIIESFSKLIEEVEKLGNKHFCGENKYKKTTLKTVDDAITELDSNIKKVETNSEIKSLLLDNLGKIRNVIRMVFRHR